MWHPDRRALRLGKRSRAAFLRFAHKASNGNDDEADAEVVERIIDYRSAPHRPPRFLEDAPDAYFNDTLGTPLPDFAHFGPLGPRNRDWRVDGCPIIGEWLTEFHAHDDGDASPCRGRLVSARVKFDYLRTGNLIMNGANIIPTRLPIRIHFFHAGRRSAGQQRRRRHF